MWRLVIIIALVPLVAAWLARHFFWTKARFQGLRHDCGTSVRELRERLGLPKVFFADRQHSGRDPSGFLLRDVDGRLVEHRRIWFHQDSEGGGVAFAKQPRPHVVLMVHGVAALATAQRVDVGNGQSGETGRAPELDGFHAWCPYLTDVSVP